MKGPRRSLSQAGGESRLSGDPAKARILAYCLAVDPDAELPFTHGFHAYPARMHPETARRALEAFPAMRVLDPFVGSGTTALEAVRRGAAFTGIDISRVPLEVAWARTRVLPPDGCRRVERVGGIIASRAFGIAERLEELPAWADPKWFSPHTLREIVALKALADGEDEVLRRLFACVLSSIVVKLSRQRSDSDARFDRDFRPRPRGAALRLFREKCVELTGSLLRLSSDLHKRKVARVEPLFLLDDARTAAPGAFDLVLTSPPYEGTYDYAAHHARRYALFGETAEFSESREIGSRRSPGRYREDMEACVRNMVAAAPRAIVLIGDGQGVRADALIGELAGKCGGRVVAGASQRRRGGAEHLLLVERS